MSKENTIELVFDKATTRLAYYPYGKEVYKNQVKPHLDFNDDITYIKFPDQIIRAASSFVQGFFEEIIDKAGYEAIGKSIVVVSKNDSLKKSIDENLLF